MSSKINKSLLVQNLSELADEAVQVRLWVQGDEDNMSSFTEAICGVFDDSGLSRVLDSGSSNEELSPIAWRLSKALDKAIRAVPEEESPEVIVAHPRMAEVRRLASELIAELQKSPKNARIHPEGSIDDPDDAV